MAGSATFSFRKNKEKRGPQSDEHTLQNNGRCYHRLGYHFGNYKSGKSNDAIK